MYISRKPSEPVHSKHIYQVLVTQSHPGLYICDLFFKTDWYLERHIDWCDLLKISMLKVIFRQHSHSKNESYDFAWGVSVVIILTEKCQNIFHMLSWNYVMEFNMYSQ